MIRPDFVEPGTQYTFRETRRLRCSPSRAGHPRTTGWRPHPLAAMPPSGGPRTTPSRPKRAATELAPLLGGISRLVCLLHVTASCSRVSGSRATGSIQAAARWVAGGRREDHKQPNSWVGQRSDICCHTTTIGASHSARAHRPQRYATSRLEVESASAWARLLTRIRQRRAANLFKRKEPDESPTKNGTATYSKISRSGRGPSPSHLCGSPNAGVSARQIPVVIAVNCSGLQR